MTRISSEERRDQRWDTRPTERIDIRVSHAGGASVGGVPLVAGPGEEIQHAVLNHLHRLALATGHPVLASVHDARTGYVVPLRVDADGSSSCTGKPVRMTPRVGPLTTEALPRQATPGTVQAPMGVFGPPPVMEAETDPVADPVMDPVADLALDPATDPVTDTVPTSAALESFPEPAPESTATPTPARGFDAVAEDVLGDGPVTVTQEGAALLTEPMTRINEAVREGRIEAADDLAGYTVDQASAVLGPDHPEVLRLRELTAYIAYLAGDPLRAFRLSLDLARLRRDTGDAEGAYGNVQSAATAWRAVRDPGQGLDLGRELIALWTQLTTEEGPAAADIARLESAHARMGRLTARAS